MKNLLILGCGYSGKKIAEKLGPEFDKIIGTSRSEGGLAAIQSTGARTLLFDGKNVSPELKATLHRASHLVVSIAPDENGDPVLPLFAEAIGASDNLQSVLYLSTVGVYGNHDGAWVNEQTLPVPVSTRSKARLEAENAWQALAQDRDLPLTIFRLSGIYGPGRNAFINIERGTARRLIKKDQVFNRIHVDDIAKAAGLALAKNADGDFNISDDEPAPPQDVVTLAHQLAGRTPPPEIDFETAELTQMQRSFYGENKRVDNSKSKTELNMAYNWPNYRFALKKMWRQKSW